MRGAIRRRRTHLARVTNDPVAGSYEHGNEPSISLRDVKYVEQLLRKELFHGVS
jgi:hypothetical protein